MYFLCIRPQIKTCLSVCLSVCIGGFREGAEGGCGPLFFVTYFQNVFVRPQPFSELVETPIHPLLINIVSI